MIVGLLGFAAPAVKTQPTSTLPAPKPELVTAATAPTKSPGEPYRYSQEARRRMSEAAKARVARDGGEQLKKMVDAAAKVNKARRARGEVLPVSDESRQKMSESAKARWVRGNGSGFRKRHRHTEETRRKMSESAKARWARGESPKGHRSNVQDALALARRAEATVLPMVRAPAHPERPDRLNVNARIGAT